MQPVLIVGAGIAGLTLAQGLKDRNIPFTVYERDSDATSRKQGYRLRLNLVGLNALKTILPARIYDDVKRTAAFVNPRDMAVIHAVSGGPMPPAPVGSGPKPTPLRLIDPNDILIRQAFSSRLPVDRTVLRNVLLAGIEEEMVWGKAADRYETTEGGVKIHFEDGSWSEEGSLLVLVDGQQSRLVKQLAGDLLQPTEIGSRSIYGLSPLTESLEENLALEPIMTSGLRIAVDPTRARDPIDPAIRTLVFETCRFTHQGAPTNYAFWVLYDSGAFREFSPDDTTLGPSHTEAPSIAERATAHFARPIRTMIQAQDRSLTSTWSMFCAKPDGLNSWPTNRRVTALGDAVHPMPPTGALAGNTALLSVATLVNALTATPVGEDKDGWSEEVIGGFEKQMLEDAGKMVALAHAAAVNTFPMAAWEPYLLADPVP